jgi:hypothetical protein
MKYIVQCPCCNDTIFLSDNNNWKNLYGNITHNRDDTITFTEQKTNQCYKCDMCPSGHIIPMCSNDTKNIFQDMIDIRYIIYKFVANNYSRNSRNSYKSY